MAGRRLLDAAALFNASRGIAQKHIALRSQQLEAYSKTSSLARAVKDQTDRVTETAKAASFLASRLNETTPTWASEVDELNAQSSKSDTAPTTSPGNTLVEESKRDSVKGIYHAKSTSDSADVASQEELDIQQAEADRNPLSDGTIPASQSSINKTKIDKKIVSEIFQEAPEHPVQSKAPMEFISSSRLPSHPHGSKPLSSDRAKELQRQSEQQIPSNTADALDSQPSADGHDLDTFNVPSGHTSPSLSSLPRVKIPKYTEDRQGNSTTFKDLEINADTFSTTKIDDISRDIPQVQAIPEQDELPEGINTDIFYSPRVAKLLRGKTYQENERELHLKAPATTPIDHTSLAQGRDQDAFNVFTSDQELPSTTPPVSSSENGSAMDNDKHDKKNLAEDIAKDSSMHSSNTLDNTSQVNSSSSPYQMRESKVPSSRLGRLWNYGGLAAGMFGGAISESVRRVTGNGSEGSYMLSPGNMDRLVTKLSRMRGAALKLGQIISFQDSKMLPPAIQQVLQRVQDSADYMPASQRNKVLEANLGSEWRDLFSSFDEKPLAAASIGQVHSAVLKSTGQRVAVKVQYPGVADSIDSDLNNLSLLLNASRLLPKGLFLDKTIANAQVELKWECDYVRESECGRRFQELLADETDTFVVPEIFPEASGKEVLTMAFMNGNGVTKEQNLTQEQKDWIGTQILRLCLREITEFRFMQTDPNWTNFLYNTQTNKLELLDFGASREYPTQFITKYTNLLAAASKSDRKTIRDLSIELGYLTGHESKAMLDAHIASILTLAEPFLESSPEFYDFQDQTITDRVKALIPVMVRERLVPPPEETYSLHRKLSGAFLLCARLGSKVPCRKLFEQSMLKAGVL